MSPRSLYLPLPFFCWKLLLEGMEEEGCAASANQKSSVIYPLCFLSSCVFLALFVISLFFNSILLFHPSLFFSLGLSFFFELYLISISFYLIYIYNQNSCRKRKQRSKKKKRNLVFKLRAKILL